MAAILPLYDDDDCEQHVLVVSAIAEIIQMQRFHIERMSTKRDCNVVDWCAVHFSSHFRRRCCAIPWLFTLHHQPSDKCSWISDLEDGSSKDRTISEDDKPSSASLFLLALLIDFWRFLKNNYGKGPFWIIKIGLFVVKMSFENSKFTHFDVRGEMWYSQ